MIFKVWRILFFSFLSAFVLSSCHLRIGEEAPSAPKFQIGGGEDPCLEWDYKKELLSYFFEEPEKSAETFSGEGWSQALDCLAAKITQVQDLIDHEYFVKEEMVNLLNQDFVKTENLSSLVDHILDPENFENYIFLKNSFIRLLDDSFKVSSELETSGSQWGACQKPEKKEGAIVLSKQEVRTLIPFLRNLSDLFLTIEREAYEIFEGFFKSENLSEPLIFKSQLQYSLDFYRYFIPFLSPSNIGEKFPAYAGFLKDSTEHFGSLLEPFRDSLQLPWTTSNHISVQDVKYLLLNLYMTESLFGVYDQDQDFVLSPEEMESLFCILLAVIQSQDILFPEVISRYIITYQDRPGLRDFLTLVYYYFFENKTTELSYLEVFRFSQFLLLNFTEQIPPLLLNLSPEEPGLGPEKSKEALNFPVFEIPSPSP